jgi:hypothetical protein
MIDASDDKRFVFHDGRSAKNIIELKEIVLTLPDAEFSQFVNDSKNDFANWTEYVLMDAALANQLRGAKSKYLIEEVLTRKIRDSLRPHDSMHENMHHDTIRSQEKNMSQKHEVHVHVQQEHPVNKWYAFFVKKQRDEAKNTTETNMNEKKEHVPSNLPNTAKDETKYVSQEHSLQSATQHSIDKSSTSENIFWIILYGLLIGIIIVIVLWKYVLPMIGVQT